MSIKIEQDKKQCKISVDGNLAIEQSREFKETLLETANRDLLLDLSRVQFLDSCCLQLIVSAKTTLEIEGKKFEIKAVSKAAEESIIQSGLEDMIPRRTDQ